MSLMDTIRGAREEAQANGLPFERNQGDDGKEGAQEGAAGAQSAGKPAGAGQRRSAARAKPSREAAAGVRRVSSGGKTTKGTANMSKEERKAERNREREKEDRRYSLAQSYLETDEEYKRARKTWWILLGVGIALVVIAFTLYGFVRQQGENANEVLAFLGLASMVLAYGCVIVGLIYDWVKIRPLRTKVNERVASMSDKRVKTILNQKAREQAEEEQRKQRRK